MNTWEVAGVLLGIIGCLFLYWAFTLDLSAITVVVGAIFIWISGILLGAENFPPSR